MRSLRFTPRPCHRCGGDGVHYAVCVRFLGFGNSTIRLQNLVARIVDRRAS